MQNDAHTLYISCVLKILVKRNMKGRNAFGRKHELIKVLLKFKKMMSNNVLIRSIKSTKEVLNPLIIQFPCLKVSSFKQSSQHMLSMCLNTPCHLALYQNESQTHTLHLIFIKLSIRSVTLLTQLEIRNLGTQKLSNKPKMV